MVSFLLLVDLAGADPGIFKRRGHCRELNTCNEQAGDVRQTKPINIYLFYFENQKSCKKPLSQ